MAQTSQWKHKSRLITCFFLHSSRLSKRSPCVEMDLEPNRRRSWLYCLATKRQRWGPGLGTSPNWAGHWKRTLLVIETPSSSRISGDTLAALAFYQHTISNRRKRNMVVNFNVGLNLPLLGCFRLCNICFPWLPSLNRLRRKMASVSLLSFS